MADFLTYKGKPLVRKGNTVYFGNMSDTHIVRLTILSKENDIADAIKIELMLSDTGLKEKDRIKKTSEKHGFYEALDLASIWLERNK
ncbi:MAG: hypothetical protein U0L72_07375 [Acutalibacteraceae bacterium]|nr:hypothetical protein [Acutalibacteraceae bacterium]